MMDLSKAIHVPVCLGYFRTLIILYPIIEDLWRPYAFKRLSYVFYTGLTDASEKANTTISQTNWNIVDKSSFFTFKVV